MHFKKMEQASQSFQSVPSVSRDFDHHPSREFDPNCIKDIDPWGTLKTGNADLDDVMGGYGQETDEVSNGVNDEIGEGESS